MTSSSICATAAHFYPCRYTGKELDTESGNDYFGARYYASSMGRFLSPDWAAIAEPVPYAHLDDPQSLNLYSYVRNNPLSRTDPDGHCPFCIPALAGLGTVGIGAETGGEIGAFGGPPGVVAGVVIGSIIGGGILAYEHFNEDAAAATPAPSSSTTPAASPEPAQQTAPTSPEITPEELTGKTRSEIQALAKEKGLVPKGDANSPDHPRKWNDPATNKERLRLDRGHVDPKTGKPYNNPNAADDHVHGYDTNGKPIEVNGDKHIPTK